jgi:hypothetical protein
MAEMLPGKSGPKITFEKPSIRDDSNRNGECAYFSPRSIYGLYPAPFCPIACIKPLGA